MKLEANRRMLNYIGLFTLIIVNGVLFGILAYVGSNLIQSTQNSHILEVSPDAQREISGQNR